jgi:hypothetical protein
MRPIRPNQTRLAATAASIAVVALTAVGTGPASAAGTGESNQSAQAEYEAAIKATAGLGVQFVSSATQQGVTLTASGDTGRTSGTQTITVKGDKVTEHMAASVLGSTGYVDGNAAALHRIIGLTDAQSSKYAGRWLSFPTTNSALGELVSGLLNSDVATELQMTGPFARGGATTVNGVSVSAIDGFAGTESGHKVPVVLYVPATGTPLPVEEVTNPKASGGSSTIHGTVAFTQWGEVPHVSAPAHALSLLKLVPASSSTTAPAG